MKHINSKEDLEEQGINLKPCIPYGVETLFTEQYTEENLAVL